MKVNIQVSVETKDRLLAFDDSYEDAIKGLLDEKYAIRLNRATGADLIEWLETQEDKNDTIRRALRAMKEEEDYDRETMGGGEDFTCIPRD